MPTDYLAELMKEAKARDKTTAKENTPDSPIIIKTKEINQAITNDTKNEKIDITPLKPEDKEEELAHSATKKEMQQFNDAFEIESSEEKAETEKELEQEKKITLKSYGEVKIFKIPGKPLNYYYTPTIRPTAIERKIINTIKEATTRLVSIASYKIRDPDERRIIYKQKVIEIVKNNPSLNIPDSRINYYADAVVREMVGYGLIDDLIKDDNLEEIMIIGPQKPVYVFHREYEMMTTNVEFFSEQEIEDLVNRIAREVGRRVDVSAPLLDARLLDGSRVNATIPPASISGGTLTIRKFRKDPYSMVDLIRMETLSSEAAAFLWMCVDGLGTKPANMLVSGGTGSGKTTLLNVLASFVQDRERVITIEDTAELNLPIKHWIRLEGRPPGIEGTGELKMDILTKNSLRMRPDRIIVGEIRHEEAFTLFTAINTGHDGCMGTVHANSPEETIVRVTNPPMNVPQIMLSGLDIIIVEHRFYDRKKGTIRRISEIAEVYGALEGNPKTRTLYERDPVKDKLERTMLESNYLKTLMAFTGLSKEQIDAEINLRKQFLERLVDKNVRTLTQVSIEAQKIIEGRKQFGEAQ